MSNESRTMLVVLLVCGVLMFGCIVLPVGLGAAFFFMASQRAEVAAAERAMAAEQAARAQAAAAQASAEAAHKAVQQAQPAPPTGPPVTLPISVPSLPRVPALPESPPELTATSPPTIPVPPLGFPETGLPDLPPEAVPAMLADIEQRKQLYETFKKLREIDEQIKTLGALDPAASAFVAGLKQQALDTFKAAGITQEHIDKIIAEGDKEGW
jgi:hypothetical protein